MLMDFFLYKPLIEKLINKISPLNKSIISNQLNNSNTYHRDVNDKNILGDTPVRIAQNNKHESLAIILINDYKANISKF